MKRIRPYLLAAIGGALLSASVGFAQVRTYNNKVTITVRADLAVITDGDINITNKVNFQSADGVVHTLYFIVPSNSNPT